LFVHLRQGGEDLPLAFVHIVVCVSIESWQRWTPLSRRLRQEKSEQDPVVILGVFLPWLEWRNWQTHGTQNPAGFTSHVGSTPTSSTNLNHSNLATYG
jgi:hypothetical protein